MEKNEPLDIWAELRKPFDPKAVGKIPKGGAQLDYVGHAAVTDRLLTVDPEWTWEPVALNEQGLPAYDQAGGLWIRLTVGGVTRLGYGDGPDPKQRIGDAIRNAAMRFGVALDLWSKDELESNIEHPENKNVRPSRTAAAAVPMETPVNKTDFGTPTTITADQAKELMEIAKKKGHTERAKAIQFINEATGLEDFTAMPAAFYDSYKKQLINAGWNKPANSTNDVDLSEVPF